jgi:hypothetical protein
MGMEEATTASMRLLAGGWLGVLGYELLIRFGRLKEAGLLSSKLD